MPPSPDKLELHGKDQFDTALDALNVVESEAHFNYLAKVQWTLSHLPSMQAQPDRFNFYANGEHGLVLKADILMGLELLSQQADTPEQMMAAQALRAVISEQ